MALNDLIYVCVASDYNLPEFESCLLRRPKHIVLMVSDFPSVQQGADRLQKQLLEHLPTVQVHRPDQSQHHSFDARRLVSCQQWVAECLVPYLAQLPNYPKACNITGGTKVSVLALATPKLAWQWLDYKDENHSLQKFCFNEQAELQLLAQESLGSASPAAVAKLNSQTVNEVPMNSLIQAQPEATAAHGQQLWDALSAPDSLEGRALLSLFGSPNTGLEAAWLYGKFPPEHKKQPLQLAAEAFIGQPSFDAQQLAWLQQWHALAPEAIQASQQHICLPNQYSKEAFKRWLAGDWLEQLVHTWLLTQLSPHAIAMNLKVNPLTTASSTGERETDIVVHSQGKTTVIEIKTDFAPNQKVKGLLQQITSLGKRLGRTHKILMIGPQLQQKIAGQMEEVKQRCQADNVTLCCNQQELLRCF